MLPNEYIIHEENAKWPIAVFAHNEEKNIGALTVFTTRQKNTNLTLLYWQTAVEISFRDSPVANVVAGLPLSIAMKVDAEGAEYHVYLYL